MSISLTVTGDDVADLLRQLTYLVSRDEPSKVSRKAKSESPPADTPAVTPTGTTGAGPAPDVVALTLDEARAKLRPILGDPDLAPKATAIIGEYVQPAQLSRVPVEKLGDLVARCVALTK